MKTHFLRRNAWSGMALSVLVTSVAALWSASAQAAEFRNMGLDEANTNNLTLEFAPLDRYRGTASDLIPGWTLTYDPTGQQVTYVGFIPHRNDNGMGGFTDAAAYVVPNGSGYALEIYPEQPYLTPAEGRFSLDQIGEIPPGTQYLEFYTAWRYWNVEINGQTISLTPVGGATGVSIFNFVGQGELFGDVSAFAGQTVDLKFTLGDHIQGNGVIDHGLLDSIQFVVPEPSTWLLLIVGGTTLGVGVYHGRGFRGKPVANTANARSSTLIPAKVRQF